MDALRTPSPIHRLLAVALLASAFLWACGNETKIVAHAPGGLEIDGFAPAGEPYTEVRTVPVEAGA